MTRYPDCESCAFYHVEDAICEVCDEGDQWESDDPNDNLRGSSGKRLRSEIEKTIHWKKAA